MNSKTTWTCERVRYRQLGTLTKLLPPPHNKPVPLYWPECLFWKDERMISYIKQVAGIVCCACRHVVLYRPKSTSYCIRQMNASCHVSRKQSQADQCQPRAQERDLYFPWSQGVPNRQCSQVCFYCHVVGYGFTMLAARYGSRLLTECGSPPWQFAVSLQRGSSPWHPSVAAERGSYSRVRHPSEAPQ